MYVVKFINEVYDYSTFLPEFLFQDIGIHGPYETLEEAMWVARNTLNWNKHNPIPCWIEKE